MAAECQADRRRASRGGAAPGGLPAPVTGPPGQPGTALFPPRPQRVRLPPGRRAIVTALTTEYMKKARGRIVAASDVTLPALDAETELVVAAELRDATDTVVARTTARWRIGPS